MAKDLTKLKSRLEKVWESPDFATLFEKIIKRPPHTIKKGTIIFNQGDPLNRLYYIKDGFVKLYRLSEDGKDVMSYLLGPGYVLGVRALLSENECAANSAETITDTTVITISHKEYFENIINNPEILVDLLHIFVNRLDYTESKLEGFMLGDAKNRTAYFLMDTAKRFGRKENGRIVLPLMLTHQKISEFVGSLRETVTVALNELEKEKVINSDKGTVTILNLKKLREMAEIKKKG